MPDPCPYLIVTPHAYQYSALGKIEFNNKTDLKGTLIGDPPGLGKTLPAMMAIVKATRMARCPSVVVVPTSCIERWKADIDKYFEAVC
jgi:superfamily II DNA or RNA helicase